MTASLILYNSFHMEDAEGWHYMYTPEKQYQNWKFDGPTFYAYTTQESGTVPIYRDHAGTPQRYRFTADAQPGEGWQRDPRPAFYAYPYVRNKALPPGTIPVYTFHAVGREGWRYSYTTEPLWGVGWQYDGVDFYAPLPSGPTVPLYNSPPSIVKVPVQDEFQLGWGVDVMSGKLHDHAVKGLQTASWNDFIEIRDIWILASSSDFSNAVRRFVLFQAFALGSSLSASGDFLLSTDVNETCLSLEADSTVRTRIELLDLEHSSPQLDQTALNLLKQDPAGFINMYGTHFIGGFFYGGYFTGTINITTHSLSQKAQLAADLKEAINLWLAGQAATSQFSANLTHTQVEHAVEARATISGQPVSAPIDDPDSLKAEVNHFADQLLSQPGQGVRLTAICYSWDVLPQVVQVLNSLPQDKQKLFQLSIQPGVLQELAAELGWLSYLANTVKALSNGQAVPTATQKSVLDQISIDINGAMSKIRSLNAAGLAKLDLQSVQQYKVAASISQRINSLV